MPKEYNSIIQYAVRDKKRGRGVGGMITGVKKNIKMKEVQKETQGNNFPFFFVDFYTITN